MADYITTLKETRDAMIAEYETLQPQINEWQAKQTKALTFERDEKAFNEAFFKATELQERQQALCTAIQQVGNAINHLAHETIVGAFWG